MSWPSPHEQPPEPTPGQPWNDPGWPPPPESERRRWGPWITILLLVITVIALLAALLRSTHNAAAPPAPPAAPNSAEPAGPAGPTPTLPLVVRGFHYTVGVSALTPTVQTRTRSATPAPPGRHFLTATLVIRNDQPDRAAPALLDSNGDTPEVEVGLAPVDSLPADPAAAAAGAPSACANDARSDRAFDAPPPRSYPGIDPHTCMLAAGVVPAHPVGSGTDDDQLAAGGLRFGTVTTTAVPDNLPVAQARLWIVTHVDYSTLSNASTYQLIP